MEAPKTAFLFCTKAEATFRTNKATALAVSPDNTAAFQAAIWSAARNAFVPTSHVAFTTACLDNGAAATVEVKGSQIILTPNEEYLNRQATDVVVKVTYGVISSDAPDASPGTGTFVVVLTTDDEASSPRETTDDELKAAETPEILESASPARRLRGETRTIATRAPSNTAPVLTAKDPQPWASAPVVESTAKTAAIADFVSVADDDPADMEAGFDYTFAVADESPVKGEFTINGDNVTFIPEEHQVGTVVFTVTATERTPSGAVSNAVDLSFQVMGVNSAPVIHPVNQYLTPQDCNGEERTLTFPVTMGDSEDEASQTLDPSRTMVTKTDPDGLITGEPSFTISQEGDERTFSLTYTVSLDAADKMGKKAIIHVILVDNGGSANHGIDSASFDIFVVIYGGTPWYPTIEIEDKDIPEGTSTFLVDVADEEGNVLFTMRGLAETILPIDYLDYTDGLLPGTYTYTFYPWSAAIGRADQPAFQKIVQVADYDTPPSGQVSATVSGNTVAFDLFSPLAQGYTLTIRRQDGTALQTIDKHFVQLIDGLLLPKTSLKLDFYEAGTYTVDLLGYNPMGDGSTATGAATFTVKEDDDRDVFFQGLDGFMPASGNAIITEDDTTFVVFRWPTLKVGYTYRLEIFDGNGLLVKEVSADTDTEVIVPLASTADSTAYLWRVVVTNSESTNLSYPLNLQIVKKSEAPVISSALTDGSLLFLVTVTDVDLAGLAYDVQYYDYDADTGTGDWLVDNDLIPDVVDGMVTLDLGFPPKAGDGLYLRAKKNGKPLGAYMPFVLVPLD
ncbi:MAG: hypothetical protein ACI4SG_07195 [Oligosphaeraceae bacterium]